MLKSSYYLWNEGYGPDYTLMGYIYWWEMDFWRREDTKKTNDK